MFFKKIQDIFSSVKENVVIIGAGEVGLHLAKRLTQEEKNVVVIDKDKSRLERITQFADVQTILGSGSSPKTLALAHVEDAHYVIAVTNDDEVNLVACLFANALSPQAVKLARISNKEYEEYPNVLGGTSLNIQLMVHPESEVVRSIDRLLSLPASQDYAEFAGGQLRMVAYNIADTELVGKKLFEFKEFVKSDNIMVAAIIRNSKLVIPNGQVVLQENDLVYFAYVDVAQRDLLRFLKKNRAFFHSVCIVGGGKIGYLLAKRFEDKGLDVKIIEKDEARCEELAALLDSTLILHGDATETTLLKEENVGRMDVIVAVTADEETNILACLLAKSMGARDSVARVNKSEYLPIVKHIGIDHSVSTRLAAVNGFLSYIRQGNVVAFASVASDAAEVMEVYLAETSQLINKPLMMLAFPKNVIMLAYMRDEKVFIPHGQTVFLAGDHVIFLGEQNAMHELDALIGEKTFKQDDKNRILTTWKK